MDEILLERKHSHTWDRLSILSNIRFQIQTKETLHFTSWFVLTLPRSKTMDSEFVCEIFYDAVLIVTFFRRQKNPRKWWIGGKDWGGRRCEISWSVSHRLPNKGVKAWLLPICLDTSGSSISSWMWRATQVWGTTDDAHWKNEGKFNVTIRRLRYGGLSSRIWVDM